MTSHSLTLLADHHIPYHPQTTSAPHQISSIALTQEGQILDPLGGVRWGNALGSEPRISGPRDASTHPEPTHINIVRLARLLLALPPPLPVSLHFRLFKIVVFLIQNTLGSPGSLAVSQHPSPHVGTPHRARAALKMLVSRLGFGNPIAG